MVAVHGLIDHAVGSGSRGRKSSPEIVSGGRLVVYTRDETRYMFAEARQGGIVIEINGGNWRVC